MTEEIETTTVNVYAKWLRALGAVFRGTDNRHR
jgi:hypothetical protein